MLATDGALGAVRADRHQPQQRVQVEAAAPWWLRTRRSRSATQRCIASGTPTAAAAPMVAASALPGSSQAMAAVVTASSAPARTTRPPSSGSVRSVWAACARSAMSLISREWK